MAGFGMPRESARDVERGLMGLPRPSGWCRRFVKSLVGEGWDFLIDLYWPRDGVHFCIYISFLFSCAWTVMWFSRLLEGQCGKFGILLAGPLLCLMEILGLLIYCNMALVCLKVIWYYDDDLQSRTLELQGEFASFQAATLQALGTAERAMAKFQRIIERLAHEICQSRARDALRLVRRIDKWERSCPGFPVSVKQELPQIASLLFLPPHDARLLAVHVGDDITRMSEQLADACCAPWTQRLGDLRARSEELQDLKNPVELTDEQIEKGIAIVAAFKPDGQEDTHPHLLVDGSRIFLRGSFDSQHKAALLKLQADGYRFLYYELNNHGSAPLGSLDCAVACCIPHMCYFLPRALALFLCCGGAWCPFLSLPSYPRRLALGCWSISLQSRLHEQVLLSLFCAAIFCLYNAATVVAGLTRGCTQLETAACTAFLIRKSLGTVVTAVYVFSMGFCCRSISRLDPVVVLCNVIVRMRAGFRKVQAFNAAVHNEVQLAQKREEALRMGKEFWNRVGGCVDQLDALDYTQANANKAASLFRAVHSAAPAEAQT